MIKHNYGCKYKAFFGITTILSPFFCCEDQKSRQPPRGDCLAGSLSLRVYTIAHLITTLTSSSLFTLGRAHASMALRSLNHNLDFVELVHARQRLSELSLHSLNHNLLAVDDVDTFLESFGIQNLTSLQVINDRCLPIVTC